MFSPVLIHVFGAGSPKQTWFDPEVNDYGQSHSGTSVYCPWTSRKRKTLGRANITVSEEVKAAGSVTAES